MEFLLFQVQAPLASWGGAAVGEFRGSDEYPGQSALLGLLGAALGLRREQESAHLALQAGYRFAIGLQTPGHLLRDYHTAQVSPKATLKGRPHVTRRDELAIPKDKLSTILSTRDYRQDAACLVLVQAMPDAPHTLAELAQALREPRHVLYLGRKSCPLAAPLSPLIVQADEVCAAFTSYLGNLREKRMQAQSKPAKAGTRPPSNSPANMLPAIAPITQVAWSESMPIACEPTFSIMRKDRIISRQGWQFGDRIEHRAIVRIGEETCISA